MSDLGIWAKPTLVGDLVTLRPYAEAGAQAEHDSAAVWEMVHDAEGSDLTATTADSEREQIDAWVRSRAAAPDRLDLVIVEHSTGDIAGEVVLNEPVLEEGRVVSANYRIALRGPAWYGRGLGTEAGQLTVQHAFTTMGVKRLTLEVLARNPRAVRSYEKIGFVESGRFAEDGENWIEMTLSEKAPLA